MRRKMGYKDVTARAVHSSHRRAPARSSGVGLFSAAGLLTPLSIMRPVFVGLARLGGHQECAGPVE